MLPNEQPLPARNAQAGAVALYRAVGRFGSGRGWGGSVVAATSVRLLRAGSGCRNLPTAQTDCTVDSRQPSGGPAPPAHLWPPCIEAPHRGRPSRDPPTGYAPRNPTGTGTPKRPAPGLLLFPPFRPSTWWRTRPGPDAARCLPPGSASFLRAFHIPHPGSHPRHSHGSFPWRRHTPPAPRSRPPR